MPSRPSSQIRLSRDRCEEKFVGITVWRTPLLRGGRCRAFGQGGGRPATLHGTHRGYYVVCGRILRRILKSSNIKLDSIPVLHSMDIHPSRELVASGQRAGRDRKSQAHVRIWSTESLQTLYVFGMGELDRGVTSVAFSQLVTTFNRIDG